LVINRVSPSSIKLPPEIAVVVVISVTAFVDIVGSLGFSFLHVWNKKIERITIEILKVFFIMVKDTREIKYRK
jgi:hypothetical protein